MKLNTLGTVILCLLLAPLGIGKGINFDVHDTLPEVLEALKRVSNADSDLKKMTYSLPRVYFNQGQKIRIGHFIGFDETSLRQIVLQDICRIHKLIVSIEENNHYRFYRDNNFAVADPFTLQEALAAMEKYIHAQAIELKEWELVSAERKFESTADHTGMYWHFQYIRTRPTDGGVGTHHFFVWADLLVDHLKDGNRRLYDRISTNEIIGKARRPNY